MKRGQSRPVAAAGVDRAVVEDLAEVVDAGAVAVDPGSGVNRVGNPLHLS
jgi:hypothetical protein